jgi:hypothetical protein
MYVSWKTGGVRSVYIFIFTLFTSGLSMWLISPLVLEQLKDVPMLYNDLLAKIYTSTIFDTVNEYEIVKKFIDVVRFTFAALKINFTQQDNNILTNLVSDSLQSINNVAPSTTSIFYKIYQWLKIIFTPFSIYDCLSDDFANFIKRPRLTFEQLESNLKAHVYIYAVLKQVIENVPIETTLNGIKMPREQLLPFLSLGTKKLWILFVQQPFGIKIVLLLKIIYIVLVKNLIGSIFVTSLISLLSGFFFVGVAYWFIVKRSHKFNHVEYTNLVQKFDLISEIHDQLLKNDLRVDEKIMEKIDNLAKNDKWFKLFKDVLGTKDKLTIQTEFRNLCKEVQEKFVFFSEIPHDPTYNTIVTTTIPATIQDINNIINQWNAVLSNKINPKNVKTEGQTTLVKIDFD